MMYSEMEKIVCGAITNFINENEGADDTDFNKLVDYADIEELFEQLGFSDELDDDESSEYNNFLKEVWKKYWRDKYDNPDPNEKSAMSFDDVWSEICSNGFDNFNHWNAQECAEWVKHNFDCSFYVAVKVGDLIVNGVINEEG